MQHSKYSAASFCRFSDRVRLLLLSKRPLKAKKDNLGVVSVIALRPVAEWIQEGVKASHVSFGQPLGERRMKWEV